MKRLEELVTPTKFWIWLQIVKDVIAVLLMLGVCYLAWRTVIYTTQVFQF